MKINNVRNRNPSPMIDPQSVPGAIFS
jgi:hypothetical protein